MLQQAIQAFESGNLDNAALTLKRVLQVDPKSLPALQVLGLIKASQACYEEAADFLGRAARISPNDASIQYNLAKALADSGNDKDALSHHKKAVSLAPNNPEAWLNYGKTASNLGQHEDALVWYGNTLNLRPDYAEAWSNKGNVLQDLKRFEEALTHYDQALSLRPHYAEAWSNKGNALHRLKRYDEAITHYDKAISLNPSYAEAWSNKGFTLYELRRYEEAITHYNQTLSLNPNYTEAWSNKGIALYKLERYEEAITHYDKAISLNPSYAEAWSNKGVALNELKCYDEAITHYDQALSLKSDIDWLYGDLVHAQMKICSWQDLKNSFAVLAEKVMANEKVSQPFTLLALNDDVLLHKKCSEILVQDRFSSHLALGPIPKYPKKEKIRIGYFSADFYNHATGYLIAELFELHEKSQFELVGISFGPITNDEMRLRLENSFDLFIDVSNKSDVEITQLSRSLNIDIAVDMKGFTQHSRARIFAYRAAPIQVNYLGYPGTMGAQYIDYIIADKTLIPQSHQQFYTEKVVTLPNSYQVNDRKRIISDRQFNKQELGLPERGFVFCCFNNNHKILPKTFDSWMRILKAVEGSVLWLLTDNPSVEPNLKKYAQQHGIDGTRLVFAERMPLSEHLARHALADLFIDTAPYNAHTTASDALWAGLPVLTLPGQSFASRVAASLLNAIGLPELITNSQEEYEALAIELAMSPQKLATIKLKLANNRLTTPLFDTPLFTKHIEAAYIKMYERYQADLMPDHITI
jgi:predicted O-linked N-acetylglucosamine transferase (SPINDLY family)